MAESLTIKCFPKKILKALPFICPVVILLVLTCTPGISFSEDLGRHLLLGRIIIENGLVPKTNFLTYTYPDFPFINHHWLSQVILYVFHSWVGLNGLIIIKMLLMTFSLGLAMLVIPVKRHQWILWLTSILSAVILAYRAHIRPELCSFIFIALLLLIFEQCRKGNIKKTRWLIIPIMLFWANAHIYFVFGIGMCFAFALENLLLKRDKSTFKNEAIWFLCVLLICIVNPNGISGFLYPFMIFSNYGVNITENASPLRLWETAINPMLLALPVLSIITLAASIYELIQLKKNFKPDQLHTVRTANLAIAVAALIASWMMARNTPLLAICALPVVANTINQLPEMKLKNTIFNKGIPVCIYSLLGVISLVMISSVVTGTFYRVFPSPIGPTPFGFDPDPERWNSISKLSAELKAKNIDPGQIFTDYNIGSLVEYQLFPVKGYVDNRPEAFPGSFWKNEYYPAFSLDRSWQETCNKRNINLIIVSLYGVHSSFIRELTNRPQWALVHLDENCAVWIRNNPANQTINKKFHFRKPQIQKYEREISERFLKLPEMPWYYRQVAADILVFRLYAMICIGEEKRAWPYIRQLYLLYPDYQAVHELMRVSAPAEVVPEIEQIYSARAKWPLSAKQVSDWANHLQAKGNTKRALMTVKRGRLFFPLSPILKDMEKDLNKK